MVVVGVLVLGALGFLVFRGLGDATMYFRTTDEAVAQRQSLGEKRFRIEGTVVPGSIKEAGTFTDFVIAGNSAKVAVHNQGQPVGLFQENIPVVLEGHFASGGDTFQSDRVMVKHSADYDAKHPERAGSAPAAKS